MTSSICPPRPPKRSNVENKLEINRSKFDRLTFTTNASKDVENVFFKSMIPVQDGDRISSVIFNYTALYIVPIYENLPKFFIETEGKKFVSSNFSILKKELKHTEDLSSKNVKEVFFESMRTCLNKIGTTTIEFKITTELNPSEKPIRKELKESFPQTASHYLKEDSKQSEALFHQPSSELSNAFKKGPVTEEPIYETVRKKTSDESSEQNSAHHLQEGLKKLSCPIDGSLSKKSFHRLPSIKEEDLTSEELVSEALTKRASNESSQSISSNREEESTKSTCASSISDVGFQRDKTGPKKSKNLLKRLIGLFSKCIPTNTNPQNTVPTQLLEYNRGIQIENPIYNKTQIHAKERKFSEDSGYVTPRSSPRESISSNFSGS